MSSSNVVFPATVVQGSVETWWETGENCFLELIVRRLIEPDYGDEEDVLPTGCKVGGSVHGFITSLSSEENFVKPGQHGVFWQFSIGRFKTEQDKLETLFKQKNYSKVRSLIVDFGHSGAMCDLSAFKHVRVLDIKKFNGFLHQDQLRTVGRLSLLRYLGLEGTQLESLPQQIIALEHLETVDIRGSWRLKELPAFKSKKLVSLISDEVRLPPIEMGEMQVLEELSTVRVGRDGDRLAKVVNESTRLRRLGVTIHGATPFSEQGRKGLMDLLGAIGNSSIQSLRFNDESRDGSLLLDSMLRCWAQQRPRHLQKLTLQLGINNRAVPEVPQKLSPSLIYLTHLSIRVGRVNTEGLCILGNLPNLVALSLQYSRTWMAGRRSIISKNGFRCLRVFLYINADGGMELQFEAGAMPQLRRLRLDFNAKKPMPVLGGVDFGIHYLTCLMQVHATVRCRHSNYTTVEAVEATIKDEVSRNRNNPVLEITREGEHRMVRHTVRDEGHTSYVEDPKDKDRKFPI